MQQSRVVDEVKLGGETLRDPTLDHAPRGVEDGRRVDHQAEAHPLRVVGEQVSEGVLDEELVEVAHAEAAEVDE